MRVLFMAIGLMLAVQGLQMTILIKATRRVWALLAERNDAELQRAGIGVFLVGLLVLVCVT
jgi:uncharacterized protein YjeT (DUF2065 family)